MVQEHFKKIKENSVFSDMVRFGAISFRKHMSHNDMFKGVERNHF